MVDFISLCIAFYFYTNLLRFNIHVKQYNYIIMYDHSMFVFTIIIK